MVFKNIIVKVARVINPANNYDFSNLHEIRSINEMPYSKILKCTALLPLACLLSWVSSENPCLQWNKDRKLSWADFKGAVPADPGKGAAWTNYSAGYNFMVINDSLVITTIACFNQNESWVITEKSTNSLLCHEQGHFDLGEVQARKFRQYASRWNSNIKITPYLSFGSDSISTVCDKLQDLYDKETEHSKNQKEQQKWNKKIDSMLNAYSAYENSTIRLLYRK